GLQRGWLMAGRKFLPELVPVSGDEAAGGHLPEFRFSQLRWRARCGKSANLVEIALEIRRADGRRRSRTYFVAPREEERLHVAQPGQHGRPRRIELARPFP